MAWVFTKKKDFCSDFEESDRIYVHGLFFLQTYFDFFLWPMLTDFFYIIRKVLLSWPQIKKKYNSILIVFWKIMGFKTAILPKYFSRY